jgi:predicted helicase
VGRLVRPSVSRWDIFHHAYAVLHHPTYRERFAEVLKKELPRVPLLAGFADDVKAGRELADAHVGSESVEPFAGLKYDGKEGEPVSCVS